MNRYKNQSSRWSWLKEALSIGLIAALACGSLILFFEQAESEPERQRASVERHLYVPK